MNHLLRPRIWTSFPASSGVPSTGSGQAPPATYRSGTETNPSVPRDGCQVARPSSSRSLRSAQSRKRVPSCVVSRQQLKLPAASCRESSKCKVLVPLYCSSLALPVRLRRTRGMRSLKHFHEISGLIQAGLTSICRALTSGALGKVMMSSPFLQTAATLLLSM